MVVDRTATRCDGLKGSTLLKMPMNLSFWACNMNKAMEIMTLVIIKV